MTHLSNQVERIPISGIRKVSEAAGEDAINLGLGQPDFPAPDHARQAAVEAIEAGEADGYTGNKGLPSLREAIAEKHRRSQGVDLDPDDVIAMADGSEALHIAIEAHVNENDGVIIPDPGFVSYDALTKFAGGEPVPVPLRDDLTLDPAAVEDVITEDTAAFVISSPGNPTGTVSPPDGTTEFVHIADEYDVLCIFDKVYEYTVFKGEHRSPIEFAETDNVVVVNSASELFSTTGWRPGQVYGSTHRVERMLRIHQYVQACASAPAQSTAEATLSGPQDRIEKMTETFRERRDLVVEGLEDIGLTVPSPGGALYVMPEVPESFVDECIDRGVIIVPDGASGEHDRGYARLSYATDTESLREAIEIMGEAYDTVV